MQTQDKYKIEWKKCGGDELIEFMVDEHDFSRERVKKIAERLQNAFEKGRQKSLKGWFGR